MPSIAKHTQPDWDFESADTKIDTHCYHNYPAMMIPQIASRLIIEYGDNAKTLFDPYCGTGTSLVEANLKDINAFGTDLNPLARLIAATKTSRIKIEILDKYLAAFNDYLFTLSFNDKRFTVIPPSFKNIDFWFKKETTNKLAMVKEFIINIKEEKVQKFFLTAFSETVRESSLTKNGEFKLCRIPACQRETFNPNVFAIISAKLARNRKGLQDYLTKMRKNTATTRIYDFNVAENIKYVAPESIDMVVTSPPYGDSKTTVAYGQFSRLTNQWLGIANAHQIDNQLMGGRAMAVGKTGIDIIDTTVRRVSLLDEKRARDVYSFYIDYSRSIANIAKILKTGGYACYVVGNRRVKGIQLPTDEITKTLFIQQGCAHINTFIRNIPHKRMPPINSPTNIVGDKAMTMDKEYIIILQKRALSS